MIERLRVRIPAGAAGEFSSPEITLCADSNCIPVYLQWQVKIPGYCAKSAGGRLYLNTHAPVTKRSRSGLTLPLSRHSVGTYLETSSHVTCKRTFGHGRLSSLSHCGLIKSGISVRELISTKQTNKERKPSKQKQRINKNKQTNKKTGAE